MTLTRPQLGVAVIVALLLHGGVALWLGPLKSDPLPEPPSPPIRISLIAPVEEKTAIPSPPIPAPPPPEPVMETVPPPPAKAKPIPKPKPAPKPEPVVQKPAPAPEPAPVAAQPVERPAETAPSPPPAVAPLDTAAVAEYERLLVAWLEKHKKYPRRAKRLRIEGEGWLRIVIDRTGRTQQIELERRTGNRLLDKAALEMARRANPFPPMPEGDPRQKLEFVVPVAFVLR